MGSVEWDASGSEMARGELRWYGSDNQSDGWTADNSVSQKSRTSRKQLEGVQEDVFGGSSSPGNETRRTRS